MLHDGEFYIGKLAQVWQELCEEFYVDDEGIWWLQDSFVVTMAGDICLRLLNATHGSSYTMYHGSTTMYYDF